MTTARLSTRDFQARDGMVVITSLGTFEPGEVYVGSNWGELSEPPRVLLRRRRDGEALAVLGEFETIEDRAAAEVQLGRALVGAETRALAQRAIELNFPLAAYMLPADWREEYPSGEDVLRIWGLDPSEWEGHVLGGREPVVIATPRRSPVRCAAWQLEYLSNRDMRGACAAGLPIIEDSAHGAWKVVKHQGTLVQIQEVGLTRDGTYYYGDVLGYWRPGYVPKWYWGGKSRRWWPAGSDLAGDVLMCGERAAEPEGRVEEPADTQGGDEA